MQRFGVGMSLVEIDCLTGDHLVLQSDIIMDLGQSLNPAIDIGQIEGAFVQGMGLFTMEQTVLLNNGELFTKGPGNYKIPSFSDIPLKFNVRLLKGKHFLKWKDSHNKKAVFSSKAVGEPPLFLGASVLFAIKDALKAQRRIEAGLEDYFLLNSPATAERIRMSCVDEITRTKCHVTETGKKWAILLED